MIKPDLKEEKKLWKMGYKSVAGLDEVGRGPLAGPVVAACVVIQDKKYKVQHVKIRDSKKLTPKQREEFYKILTKSSFIKWGIGRVSEKTIDKINIFKSTKLAMKRAVNNLGCKADYLIVDGNMKLPLPVLQKSIIRADEKVFSCAAASIIAKVTRDRLMCRLAKKYPHYGFEKHKGYGTKKHKETLKEYGFCQIHRQSFRPVSRMPKSSFTS